MIPDPTTWHDALVGAAYGCPSREQRRAPTAISMVTAAAGEPTRSTGGQCGAQGEDAE
jgi:hypothetical protein